MVGGMTHSESGHCPPATCGVVPSVPRTSNGAATAPTAIYDFATKRPGWGKTIEQLFMDNDVSAYFHGHDHQYVYETRDGIVYQEVPSAGILCLRRRLHCWSLYRRHGR